MGRLRWLWLLGCVGLLGLPSRALAAGAGCHFVLGFQALEAQLPAVGSCLNEEHPDPAGNGNQLQDTAAGLLVWNRAGNWMSFTNGYHTWLYSSHGLQERLNSQRFAWELAAGPRRHVVFVAGYDTSSAGAQQIFTPLEAELAQVDGFAPADFTIFSYNGDSLGAGGSFAPLPYAACDSGRPLDQSGPALARFLSDYQAAVGGPLVVVGHSLGGLLAYQLPRWTAHLALDSVVTVDAPLHGVGASLAFFALFAPCSSLVVQDLATLGQAPDLEQQLAGWAAGLHAMGARVATVASAGDCVYDLPLCGLPGSDERATQTAPADWAITVPAAAALASPAASHLAALSDASALAQIASFIGPQRSAETPA
ncbi:MAG: esterase/lipase family protein [Chloroflexota bacterium]